MSSSRNFKNKEDALKAVERSNRRADEIERELLKIKLMITQMKIPRYYLDESYSGYWVGMKSTDNIDNEIKVIRKYLMDLKESVNEFKHWDLYDEGNEI